MNQPNKSDQQWVAEALPCPFCNSTDLTTSWWSDDDGEFTAISCRGCKAEAPAHTWNNRANETDQTLIQQLGNDGEVPDGLKNL